MNRRGKKIKQKTGDNAVPLKLSRRMIKRHRERGWDTARDNRGEKGDRRKEFKCILVVLSWQTHIQYRSSFRRMVTQRIHVTPHPGCESHGSHLPAPALTLLHTLVHPNSHTHSNHSPQSTSATSTATTAIFTAQCPPPRGQASCHKALSTGWWLPTMASSLREMTAVWNKKRDADVNPVSEALRSLRNNNRGPGLWRQHSCNGKDGSRD